MRLADPHSSTSCHHEPHPPLAEQSTWPTMSPLSDMPHAPTSSQERPQVDTSTAVNERKYCNAQNPTGPQAGTASHERDRPSPYLRSRCPLCFGGNNAEVLKLLVHLIVCIDANFHRVGGSIYGAHTLIRYSLECLNVQCISHDSIINAQVMNRKCTN